MTRAAGSGVFRSLLALLAVCCGCDANGNLDGRLGLGESIGDGVTSAISNLVEAALLIAVL